MQWPSLLGWGRAVREREEEGNYFEILSCRLISVSVGSCRSVFKIPKSASRAVRKKSTAGLLLALAPWKSIKLILKSTYKVKFSLVSSYLNELITPTKW